MTGVQTCALPIWAQKEEIEFTREKIKEIDNEAKTILEKIKSKSGAVIDGIKKGIHTRKKGKTSKKTEESEVKDDTGEKEAESNEVKEDSKEKKTVKKVKSKGEDVIDGIKEGIHTTKKSKTSKKTEESEVKDDTGEKEAGSNEVKEKTEGKE